MKRKKGFLIFLFFMLSLCFPVQAQQVSAGKTQKTGTVKICFYDEHGTEYTNLRKTVRKNAGVSLPGMKNSKEKSFLGWSKTPGKKTGPDYKEGTLIKAGKNMRLYAVMFDRSLERNVTCKNIQKVNTKKYSKVIFVGDSRTNSMRLALERDIPKEQLKNTGFAARNGAGLKWFKSDGYGQLMKEISSTRGKPAAIVFNLGVNDLKHSGSEANFDASKVAKTYAAYLKELAGKLQGKNCRLFYMSVNPINESMLYKKGSRRESDIELFNRILQKELKGKYTFIDTNTWMYENGFSTGRLETDIDDGVHYTAKTYKRIYNYCLKRINSASV